MKWNDHSNLLGEHAFLSPSKHHWLNYDTPKLRDVYANHLATLRGTELHEFAATAIKLGQRLARTKKTLNLYVNDAIHYRMSPEVTLFYSYNCFGTADAIIFEDNFLRIHDLKTGTTPASMHQLEIYAALFCLEYDVDPEKIGMELRIYQNDEVLVANPPFDVIRDVMNTIIECDREIELYKFGE